jgi:hypothetical protein
VPSQERRRLIALQPLPTIVRVCVAVANLVVRDTWT